MLEAGFSNSLYDFLYDNKINEGDFIKICYMTLASNHEVCASEICGTFLTYSTSCLPGYKDFEVEILTEEGIISVSSEGWVVNDHIRV